MKTNMTTPPIFVISLARSPTRRKNMIRRLNLLGVSYEIVDAVDGHAISPADYADRLDQDLAVRQFGRKLTAGEVGCYLSHYRLWEKMTAEQIPLALILEDDAEWGDDFLPVIESLQTIPHGCEVILLSPFKKYPIDGVLYDIGNSGYRLVRYKKRATTTAGYLITLSGAKKLLDYCRIIREPIDRLYASDWKNGVVFYCIHPALVRQAGGETAIDYRNRVYGNLGWRFVASCFRKWERMQRRIWRWRNPVGASPRTTDNGKIINRTKGWFLFFPFCLLSFRFWKRRWRSSPLLRPHCVRSHMMRRRWNFRFNRETVLFFRGCKFYPDNSKFAMKPVNSWRGIFQNRVAPSSILEIGSWQGSSAVAFAGLFADACMTCVDTWKGSDSLNMQVNPEELFDYNTAVFSGRLKKMKSDSLSALISLANDNQKFDLIYVDGSHFADDVMMDTILCWRLLNVGGVMIWDDYLWEHSPYGDAVPRLAIDWFLRRWKGNYLVLFVHKQVIVEKTAEGIMTNEKTDDKQ